MRWEDTIASWRGLGGQDLSDPCPPACGTSLVHFYEDGHTTYAEYMKCRLRRPVFGSYNRFCSVCGGPFFWTNQCSLT